MKIRITVNQSVDRSPCTHQNLTLAGRSLRLQGLHLKRSTERYTCNACGTPLVRTLKMSVSHLLPEVITKKVDGELQEPIEQVVVDCPEEFIGVVTEALGRRKGQMTKMINNGTGRVRLEYEVPSRGLIGFRGEFLTETKGTGLLNTIFLRFDKWQGEMKGRGTGSLVSDRMGETTTYALYALQERGKLFVNPQTKVYEGMLIGENARAVDLVERKQAMMPAA